MLLVNPRQIVFMLSVNPRQVVFILSVNPRQVVFILSVNPRQVVFLLSVNPRQVVFILLVNPSQVVFMLSVNPRQVVIMLPTCFEVLANLQLYQLTHNTLFQIYSNVKTTNLLLKYFFRFGALTWFQFLNRFHSFLGRGVNSYLFTHKSIFLSMCSGNC